MIDTRGLSIRSLELRLERAISDYLSVSRRSGLFAHDAAHDQAEEDAWERLLDARAELDARRAEEDAAPESPA